MIKFSTLIVEVRNLAGYGKSMGETRSDPKLPLFFMGQLYTVPLAKGRRALADIYGNVKNASQRDADKFSLRKLFLKMQAAQRSVARSGMIILDKR